MLPLGHEILQRRMCSAYEAERMQHSQGEACSRTFVCPIGHGLKPAQAAT